MNVNKYFKENEKQMRDIVIIIIFQSTIISVTPRPCQNNVLLT